MKIITTPRLCATALALALGLAVQASASAQTAAPSGDDAGLLTGQVARCVNGAELPAGQVAIGVDGGGGSLARTDSSGEFFLTLPPGQYTVIATASDGTASRQYVPVESGQALDIGILDIGGGVAGCGPDSDITAPVLPTLVPTPVATVAAPAATAVPTVVPTVIPTPVSTPVPDPPTDSDQGG